MRPSRMRMVWAILSLVVLVAVLTSTSVGQSSYTSQIRGVVTDASGAVVQNATITITNEGTNIASSAKTDSSGLYHPDRTASRLVHGEGGSGRISSR